MGLGNYILIGLAFLIFLVMILELRHKILVAKTRKHDRGQHECLEMGDLLF